MTVAAMVLLPSARARGWMKVKLAKHLFEHRYDYRSEWLRFTETLGRAGPDAPPLSERIVKAFADIVDTAGRAVAGVGQGRRPDASPMAATGQDNARAPTPSRNSSGILARARNERPGARFRSSSWRLGKRQGPRVGRPRMAARRSSGLGRRAAAPPSSAWSA